MGLGTCLFLSGSEESTLTLLGSVFVVGTLKSLLEEMKLSFLESTDFKLAIELDRLA